jgi:N-glycosidase YbiA
MWGLWTCSLPTGSRPLIPQQRPMLFGSVQRGSGDGTSRDLEAGNVENLYGAVRYSSIAKVDVAIRTRSLHFFIGEKMNIIYFYRTNDDYGIFSNFTTHKIELDGKVWPTVEHYFQAMKFEGTPYVDRILKMRLAGDAAKFGRSRDLPLREDWEHVKNTIMFKAVLAKFTQHDEARAILLGTGDAIIVERTHNDSYWADGGDGTGRNMLGHILMMVRHTIRQMQEAEAAASMLSRLGSL